MEKVGEYLIVRLGRVFGVNKGEGVFTDALERYEKGEEILSNDYEELSLTYSGDIARGIRILLEMGKRGIFHIDTIEHKNRFEFVRDFFDYLGIKDAKVKKCPIEVFNFIEPRARNQFSDNSKFIQETGFEFTLIEKCFELIKERSFLDVD